MLTDFKIPELGENITSGTIVRIAVAVGQTVKKDQALLELETDKASIEVPSPVAGVIKDILVKEGTLAKVGQVVMKIEAGASAPASPAPAPGTPKAAAPASSPAPKPQSTAASAPSPAAVSTPAADHASVPAAPTVRRLARELGVDITKVTGTGPGGRISKEDVKAYVKSLMSAGGPSAGAGIVHPPLPDFARFGQVERQAMNNIRRKTAEHLTYAWSSIPHVTQFDKVDITELEKLRKKYSTKERKLTITPFLMKVVAAALKAHPQFNSSVDMGRNEIVLKKYFNIGVAVDTDRGLLVPVIRDVEKKSVFELADELAAAAERARTKKTSLDEMQGGCFTITNLGGIGGTMFTPIVNTPEVAILGVSRSQMEPCYTDFHCTPRLMLPLSLSYDHRVIDGADGARFLRWVCDALQQPFLMDLEKK